MDLLRISKRRCMTDVDEFHNAHSPFASLHFLDNLAGQNVGIGTTQHEYRAAHVFPYAPKIDAPQEFRADGQFRVLMHRYGRGASLFTGVYDNTDVFFKLGQAVLGGVK
ncbi:MAG: hypothetical protein D4R84_14400 [Rhodocyclaceae bacterium]|nr:MAG: hypothetical protein D4R84_14400 [Rhodocyclaceae bacterium]